MKSMTGYGKSSIQIENIELSIEIRSVNNRFLDISVRMPKDLNEFEFDIRNLLKKRLTRGKINVYINIADDNNAAQKDAQIDIAKVKQRYEQLKLIKNTLNLTDEIKIEHLLNFNDIFEPGFATIDKKLMKESILDGVNSALNKFEDMRKAEGMNLLADMSKRIEKIEEWTQFVIDNGRNNIKKEFERLQNNIYSLIDSSKIDKNRLETEIALISDKVDITEECVRMSSHLQLFKETLQKSEEAGKKLTFILQEMLREANTMNSKTTETEISHKVIRIKEEIEKIREQAQNVE